MGIVPIWGYQMIAAFALAHLMRLNKAIVIVASNISIPPMIPFILYGSVMTGALLLGQPMSISLDSLSLEWVKNILLQYVLGSLVFGLLVGMLGGLFTFVMLKFFRKKS